MIPRISPPFELDDVLALAGGALGRGGGVAAFEAALAAHGGTGHAVVFPYGRSGLFALAKVLGWEGREIILPAYSCAVVPNALVTAGVCLRFVDVTADDFAMDPLSVQAALGPATAAVLATHMHGLPMDVAGLERALVGRPDVTVVHDCALAFAAEFDGRPLAAMGAAGLLSFSFGKHLSTVEGGAVVTGDAGLARDLRDYRDRMFRAPGAAKAWRQSIMFLAGWIGLTPWLYGMVHRLATQTRLLSFLTEYYDRGVIVVPDDLTGRLPECLGSLGVSQVVKAARLVGRRVGYARYYRRELGDCPQLRWPSARPGATFSHCACLVEDRDSLLHHLLRRGIHAGKEVFDYALTDFPAYGVESPEAFPVARAIAREVVLLPNHSRLEHRDAHRVVQAVREWCGR